MGNISIQDFEALKNEEEIRQFIKNNTTTDLVKLLMLIKEKRAVRWEDRAILQMVEKSPLTFWASDKSYNVVLWSETCKKIYNRDLKDKPFYEAMSIYERTQAMKDSISVIEADENTLVQLLTDFRNYYTRDLEGKDHTFSLVTNSMQLVDDETGTKYYAEIGLPIDIEVSLKEYELRQSEFNKQVEGFKTSVEKLRDNLTTEIKRILKDIRREKNLTESQKDDLLEKVNQAKSNIESNLDKSKNAFDFDTFVSDNEAIIESTIDNLEQEISSMIEKRSNSVDADKFTEDPELLQTDIEHCIEQVVFAYDEKIKNSCTATVNKSLKEKQKEYKQKLQTERDEIIRNLKKDIMYIPQASDDMLKKSRQYINDVYNIISNL